jgi:hypothetical protein
VEAVEDRQAVQEEEEEMKMENMEGTENMEGSESNENVSSMSSGAIGGEISGSPQKRTYNNTRAVSTGVANDSKQALTPYLAACGLIDTISTSGTYIYNSMNINKATLISNRLNIN